VAFEGERDELHKLFPVIDRLNDELQKLAQAHTMLIGQREALQSQLVHTQAELSATQGELSGVYASNSWKITAPLRRLVKAMRRG
jgi:hypothetical protein